MSDYHRGKKLKNIIDSLKPDASWSISQLAIDGMGIERESLYRMFNNGNLDWGYIVKALVYLNYEGIEEFPDIPEVERSMLIKLISVNLGEGVKQYKEEFEEIIRDRDEWKQKYIIAIERENISLRMDVPWLRELAAYMKSLNESMKHFQDASAK